MGATVNVQQGALGAGQCPALALVGRALQECTAAAMQRNAIQRNAMLSAAE